MLFKKFIYRQALNALALGEYDKAERLFKKIHKTGQNGQGIRHNIAVTLMAQEKFEEAESWFLMELNDYGECFSRTLALGDLYYNWGKREESQDFYSRALSDCTAETMKRYLNIRIKNCSDPEHFQNASESLRLLKEGRRLAEQGEIEKALETLERSFALDKSQYQSLNEAGVILLNHKGEHGKAHDYFKKALTLSDLSIIRRNRELAAEKLK